MGQGGGGGIETGGGGVRGVRREKWGKREEEGVGGG